MRKLYTLLLLLFLGSVAWGQDSFEFVTTPNRSTVNSIEYLNGRWFTFGASGSFFEAKVMIYDTTGKEVWKKEGLGFDAWFNASVIQGNSIYAVGTEIIARDYPDNEANGFIIKVDTSGSLDTLVVDTTYKSGFTAVAAWHDLIIVAAAEQHWYDDADQIVAYDTLGNKMWEYSLGWAINGLAAQGNRIFAFGADSIISLNMQGQRLPFGIRKSIVDMKPWQNDLVVVDNREVHFYDTDLTLLSTLDTGFTLLDEIELLATTDDQVLIEGLYIDYLGTSSYEVISFDPSNLPFLPGMTTLDGSDRCHNVTCLAGSASHVSIGGREVEGRLDLGFVYNRYYGQLLFQQQDLLRIIEAEVVTDTIWSTRVRPGSSIGQYDTVVEARVHINITLEALSSFKPVNSFLINTIQAPSFTGNQFSYKFFADSLSMTNGDTMQVAIQNIDIMLTSSEPYVLPLYLRAVNGLTDLTYCDTGAYLAPELLYIDVHDKTLPTTNINIYPNPSTGIYHIGDAPMGSSIMVQDLQGRVVLTAQVHDKTTLDLSAQPQGMYLYTVTDTDGRSVASGKLLKQ